jgi:D-serine dehydratase
LPYVGLTKADVDDAHAPQPLRAVSGESLPETAATGGIIESELVAIPAMQARLEKESGKSIPGTLLLKKTAICRFPARLKRAAASMRC